MENYNIYTNVLKHITRRLVQIAVHYDFSLSQFESLLKALYVEEATKVLISKGEKPTQSRISIMTGVHRKDVKDLQEDNPLGSTPSAPLAARVLSLWLGNKKFLDSDGTPLSLPLRGTESPNFEELVSLVGRKNVAARTVLNQLVSKELVVVKNKVATLQQDNIAKNNDEESQLHFLARNAGNYLSACVENILHKKRHFERAVYFDQIDIDTVEEIRVEIKKSGMNLLKKINRIAQRGELDHEPSATDSMQKLHVGLVCYVPEEA